MTDERPVELPSDLTQSEDAIVQMVHQTAGRGRHAARSALRHIALAERLAGADPEMAAFRAITAEEEAASAVFYALKRHGYPGAEALSVRSHVHKNALVPFLASVKRATDLVFEHSELQAWLSTHAVDGEHRFRLHLWYPGVPVGKRLEPVPPFHFTMSFDDRRHDFAHELKELSEGEGIETVKAYLGRRANKRNRLLYASADGVPRVTDLIDFLPAQRTNVFSLLANYLFVDPWPEHQNFVEQCLQAFLAALGHKSSEFDPASFK